LREGIFDRVSVFAYSQEEDTIAAKMEQIAPKIIRKRLKMVESITRELVKRRFSELIGTEQLVEITGYSSEGEMFFGGKLAVWDFDIDGEVLINDASVPCEAGGLYKCRITGATDDKLIGEIYERV